MEGKRKEVKDDVVWKQELAAYFTHCNLQKVHLRLDLLNAMGVWYKRGNFNTSVNFSRWLLESEAPTNHVTKAQQVLQACERQLQDANKLNYDFRNPFVVCGATFTPIYRGQKDVSCPYCTTHFVPSIQGNLCTICELAVVGSDASGLLCSTT